MRSFAKESVMRWQKAERGALYAVNSTPAPVTLPDNRRPKNQLVTPRDLPEYRRHFIEIRTCHAMTGQDSGNA